MMDVHMVNPVAPGTPLCAATGELEFSDGETQITCAGCRSVIMTCKAVSNNWCPAY